MLCPQNNVTFHDFSAIHDCHFDAFAMHISFDIIRCHRASFRRTAKVVTRIISEDTLSLYLHGFHDALMVYIFDFDA